MNETSKRQNVETSKSASDGPASAPRYANRPLKIDNRQSTIDNPAIIPHSPFAIRYSLFSKSRGLKPTARERISAFTLVEMLVVVAIVIVIAALTVPAVSTMWEQRKLTDAENTIQGLLMTTRARAVSTGEREHGILFYMDDKDVQRIVPIVQAKLDETDPEIPCNPANHNAFMECLDAHRLAYLNAFTVQSDRNWSLPAPLRAAPRIAVLPDESSPSTLRFSDAELTNNDFYNPPGHHAQRHRNFFTMVFSADGRLLNRPVVLIQDIDEDGDGRGDLTGLRVLGPSRTESTRRGPATYFHEDRDGNVSEPRISPLGSTPVTVPFLVVERVQSGQPAINFPSVDGVLLYDDALFSEIEQVAEKRRFMLDTAQPLYVNSMTGALIRGPVGEARR